MNDFLQIRIEEHKVKIVNNDISAFRAKDILRSGARAFDNAGRTTSASRVGEASYKGLVEECGANSAAALSSGSVPRGSQVQQWNLSEIGPRGNQVALKTAEEQAKHLSHGLPNFICQGHVSAASKQICYANSLGASLKLHHDTFSFNYEFRRKGSPNIADCFIGHENALAFNAKGDLDWIIELLQCFDEPALIQPGPHKVLMQPDYRSLNKVGESLRADLYCEGTALYSGRRGQKILSDKFSLNDLRFSPERGGLRPFDFEGSVAQGTATPLIAHGALEGLISDLKNEGRYGISSTANGFRGYNSSINLDFAHLALEPGQRSFRKILQDAGPVIVSVMAVGGDVTAQGDFSTPIQLSFLVKDGAVVGRLPALTMSSTLEKMFGSRLLEVAADGEYAHSPQPFLLAEMDIQIN
jgi:PmbA protein